MFTYDNTRIQQVQPHDRGQYECQVSTEKKLSLVFQLHVVIPKVVYDIEQAYGFKVSIFSNTLPQYIKDKKNMPGENELFL